MGEIRHGEHCCLICISLLTIFLVSSMKHLVGRLIGKQGRYVSFLKQTSGAKIYISTLPYSHDFQICHIEGEMSLFSLIPSLLVVIRWARIF